MSAKLKRRKFITLLGGAAAAWPIAARAQQPERMRRIGVLMNLAANDPQGHARVAAFLQGLQQLGWVDGRNLRIDTRWGAADAAQIRRHAAELAALAPDVILAPSRAAKIPCRPSRQRDDQITMNNRWPAPRHNQTAIWGARECAPSRTSTGRNSTPNEGATVWIEPS